MTHLVHALLLEAQRSTQSDAHVTMTKEYGVAHADQRARRDRFDSDKMPRTQYREMREGQHDVETRGSGMM